MRLINKSGANRYCSLAGTTVKPGMATRELNAFEDAWNALEKACRGFDIILSPKDIHVLVGLCSKFLAPAVDGLPPEDSAALGELKAHLADPDGTACIEKAAIERTRAIQKLRAEVLKANLEREAAIRAESNMIGPDGNPIPKEAAKIDGMKDVKPELHPEMHNDLKSVIENNLAVMRTASGQPISDMGRNAVVAKPGGTPVSHDPAYYQKMAESRKTPPGVPEY